VLQFLELSLHLLNVMSPLVRFLLVLEKEHVRVNDFVKQEGLMALSEPLFFLVEDGAVEVEE